jgi:phage-related protein (TIGR01555 family)
MKWFDGIVDLYNSLANDRNATSNNVVSSNKVDDTQLNEIYKTGLGNKIVRVKSGYALKSNALNFSSIEDRTFYLAKLEAKVKKAFKWSLVFGRGIIVINDGTDLSLPLEDVIRDNVKFDVFSGDMVSVTSYEMDLSGTRYLQPEFYNVRGYNFHYSRVIDLTYLEVTDQDAPTYNYGGLSEYELIYNQIVNDGIVERASASILEKNSSLFYKIKGFKTALENKQESNLVKFYKMAEDRRSIYGAGLIDADDDVMNVSQSLTNLKEADDISLRRIALVTGIPLPMLVGESVGGLNSAGTQEKTSFNEMIELLQQDYLVAPLNALFGKLGMSTISFKDNQNVTPLEKVEYETKVIDNAVKLNDMGYDAETYMKEHGVQGKSKDDFTSEFTLLDDVEDF